MVAHTLDALQMKILGKKLFKFIDPIVDYPGFLAAGGSTVQWQEASECYEKGILPRSTRQVTRNVLEKSFDLISEKYPQYQVKEYVDVRNRDPRLWGLVGNGDSYPSVYKGGVLVRPGCGWMYRDEGMGCLNVEAHEGNMGKVKLITNKCWRPQCPVDYKFWAVREAGRIEDRFRRVPKKDGAIFDPEGKVKHLGVPIHVTISVPEKDAGLMDLVTLEVKKKVGRPRKNTNQMKFEGSDGISSIQDEIQYYADTELVKAIQFKKLKAKVAKIAKMVGFKAGCMVFHPFANKGLDEKDVEGVKINYDSASGNFDYNGLKAYMDRVNGSRVALGEPQKESKMWFIRPHFHLIGYGWIDYDLTPVIEADTGYVVKKIGVCDSVFNTALYQLSHAGYKEGHHTVSWVGEMSNRTYKKLNPLPELPLAPAKCPECGDDLKAVEWVGEGESPLSDKNEERIYMVSPEGWRYKPDVWVDNRFHPDGGYWKSGLRSRLVSPTDDELQERDRMLLEVSR